MKNLGNMRTEQAKGASCPDMRLSVSPPGKTVLISIAVIILVSTAVYFNALYNGFAYDDTYQIVQNHWIKDIKHLPDIFSKGVWGFDAKGRGGNYYRPLMYVSYLVEYRIFGLNPWGFHLTNILLHSGVSVLVYLIIGGLLGNAGIAAKPSATQRKWWLYSPLIAALLFAAHPIHTEAVTWISALPECAFSFFTLLSFYFYSFSRAETKRRDVFLSLAFFSVALLYKETAVTLPLALMAYDYSFKKQPLLTRGSAKKYMPYFIVIAFYLCVRFLALGGFAPVRKLLPLTDWQYFINMFPLILHYAEKLLLPLNLHAVYIFHPVLSLFAMRAAVSFGLVVVSVVVLYILSKKAKPVFFGMIMIFVPLLPALYIPGLGDYIFNERYLYLPSFGFVFLLALLIEWCARKAPKKSGVIASACIALIGLYSAGTVTRNPVWKNTYTLYDDVIKKEPGFDRLALQIAMLKATEFLENGEMGEAADALKWAVRLKPDYADAYAKLGLAYEKMGLTDSAVEQFKIAARLDHTSADIRTNLGNAFFTQGLIDDAIGQYQDALRLNSSLVEAHYNLALAYEQKGSVDKAIEHLKAAMQLDPSNPAFEAEMSRVRALEVPK